MENIETLLAAVAQTQGFDDDEPLDVDARPLGFPNSPSSPEIRVEMGEPELAGAPFEVCGDDWPSVEVYPLPLAAVPAIGSGEKKKRGRPPRGQLAVKPPLSKRIKQEDEDEDVCFICFDGGSLVLCDRKGCPKAYHPACIKRDEAFFQTKAKWNCGWHICSVCRKSSHYLCYTCTYSLCKRCTKDADYVCVRGNNGFCSTCMKIIMLIENKDQANSDSVHVDFDDKLSWEYLFKVYWVLLKDKLSLTLNELTQARKPWKGVTAVGHKPQWRNAYYSAIDEKASISYRSNGHLELNKPYEDISLPQIDRSKDGASGTDNHVETQINAKEAEVPGYNKHPEKPNMDGFTAKPSIDQRAEEPGIEKATDKLTIEEATDKPTIERVVDKTTIEKAIDEPNIEKATDRPSKPCNEKTSDKPSIEKAADEPDIEKTTDKPGIEKDGYNPGIVENTIMPYICKNRDEIKEKDPKSGPCNSTEWATKDLLEFVAHMKNGDTSPLSQFDVQTLILDYIKRNNLRDPHRKSQIICDLRLANLFGRARVGHIEMLKLLEYHFLIKEDSKKNSFIPAGFVGSPDTNVDGNNCNLTMPIKSRKRKSRKKIEERAPQNNLSAYAAIDFHNINLIYLRRNLMENLIDDKEKFNDKVIGSIVRIKLSSNDQKPDVHRLVQVVGTGKVTQPYKVGDRTTDIMLEVLNLDKKEAVSIASISNQEFTEDECRRLRQSIRCGFMKQFTVGEIQNKAKTLQLVRVNDWLEAEILRLNHLRDRASEKGHKKELREYVHKLQLLKSPEEYKRRISEVPEIHTNPNMSTNYESEEDAKHSHNVKKDEYQTASYPGFSRSERNTISPNKKGKQEASIQAQNQLVQNISASGSHSLEKKGRAMHRSNFETATASTRNSPSTNHIEMEKLWHYRDPNGKIQGPFSMMQLRKWSTTGLFPPDMRIWTHHEQYDSLLLTHAMNRQFHGESEQPQNASLGTQRQESTMVIGESEGFGVTDADSKRTEAVSSNHTIDLSQRDSKQNNAASSCHAIDLSERVSKQTNAYSSNHAVDLAERDKEANADSCPNTVDLAERDSKQTNAVDLTGEDRKQTNADSSNHAIDLSEIESKQTKAALSNHAIDLSVRESEQTNAASSNHAIDFSDRDRKQINVASSDHKIDLSDGNTGPVKTDETNSPAWPQCWDLLKDSYPVADNVQVHNVLHSSSLEQTNAGPSIRDEESGQLNHDSQNEAKSPSEPTQDQMTSEHEVQSQSGNQGHVLFSAEETLRSLSIDLMSSNDMDSESLPVPALGAGDAIEPDGDLHVADLNTPIIMPNTSKAEIAEKQKHISADVIHMQTFLELLSPTPRSNDEDQGVRETDEKQSGLIGFPLPNSGPSWTSLIAGAQLPDEDWCGYSPTPAKPQVQEWDPGLVSASSLTPPPPEVTSENVVPSATNNNNDNHLTLASPSYPTSWLAMLNEPIEFDALGEESVSDLLAEVDAMESQGGGGFPSPTSAMKFAKELQDCKDDCFSSIEDFRSAPHPVKSDAFSSTEEVQLAASQSSGPTPIDFLDTLRRSGAHSSASSEGETNAPAFSSSEYHHPAPSNTNQDMVGANVGPNTMDPGWGTVQGNINLVTVQGNVNLVLGGPAAAQGIANLGWGTNPGTPWGANPNINRGPINGGSLGLPWDGQQRKYEGERFTSPREWSYQGGQAAFGRGGGRPPWGRQAYGGGGGGYSRPIPKGQRVCKFYESGRCKKGAFCDYLHP